MSDFIEIGPVVRLDLENVKPRCIEQLIDQPLQCRGAPLTR